MKPRGDGKGLRIKVLSTLAKISVLAKAGTDFCPHRIKEENPSPDDNARTMIR